MQEGYFQFNLYGDGWGEIARKRKYVLQNKDNIIERNSALPFLVFHYIVNYNLDDLELFFRLAGFSSFSEEELPNIIITPINLPSRENVHNGWFGDVTNEEEAQEYIEVELGEGIIAKYRDVKKKQLLHKNFLLEQQRKSIREELKNYTEPEEAVQHTFK